MEIPSLKNLNSLTVALVFIILIIYIIYTSIKIIDKKKLYTFLDKFPAIRKSVVLIPVNIIYYRVFIYGLFLLFVISSLFNPSFEEEKITDNPNLQGVDIVFVIDVSLSMNAEDNGISRFSAVKESILSVLPYLSGNRFGIITFAGSPFLYCPMTSDPGAFSDYVRGLESDMIPDTGTNLKKAFEKADSLLKSQKVYRNRLLVLLTDGEDSRESMPEYFPGTKVLVFGIGLEEGSFIRYIDEARGLAGFLTREGTLSGDPRDPLLVRSAQNTEFLKKVALRLEGDYINLTKNSGGAREIISKIKEMEKNSEKSLKEYSKKDGYQYFLFPAFFIILLDLSILEYIIYRRKKTPEAIS